MCSGTLLFWGPLQSPDPLLGSNSLSGRLHDYFRYELWLDSLAAISYKNMGLHSPMHMCVEPEVDIWMSSSNTSVPYGF